MTMTMEAARTRYFSDALKFAIESKDTDLVNELLHHEFSHEAIVPSDNKWPQSPLLEAVSTSQIDVATALLRKLGRISSDKLLGKCLMCAIGLRSKPLVELLISYGADINCAFDYASPLARACILGDVEISNFIHEKGGKMFGKDILPSLASRGYDKIVDRLLNWGEFTEEDVKAAMKEACTKGFGKVLELLLNCKIKLKLPDLKPVLETALEKNQMSIVKMLISNCDELRDAMNDYNNGLGNFILDTNDKNHNDSMTSDDGKSSLDLNLLFHLAVINGNCDMIRSLHRYGADPNGLRFGNTPLYTAVISQMSSVIPLLIELGADVNSKNTRNRTALHAAARIGISADIVSVLLDSGAEIAAKDDQGRLPLMEACELGACKPEVIQMIIDKFPGAMNEVDKNLSTALHIAATRGRSIVAVHLINQGSGVAFRDSECNTPLHLACRSGSSEIVNAIAESRFSSKSMEELVNSVNKDGKTALHLACAGGYVAIITKLLSLGAKTHLVDNKYYTPLHYSVAREEAVAILVNNGVSNIDAVDKNGNTALHLASQHNPEKPAVITELVKAGADVNALNDKQLSPLMLCCSFNSVEALKILLKEGANVNHRNPDTRDTPFLCVCKYTPKTMIRSSRSTTKRQCWAIAELLAHGAREDDINLELMGALDLACHTACNLDLMKYLLKKLSKNIVKQWLAKSAASKVLCRTLQKPMRFRRFSLSNTAELLKVLVEYGAEINLNEKYVLELYEWNTYVANLVICLGNSDVPTLLIKMAVTRRDILTLQRLSDCGYPITQRVLLDFCSYNGQQDAVDLENFIKIFKLHQSQVPTLKNVCRLRIRLLLRSDKTRCRGILHGIRGLPLPNKLKEFLAFMSLPDLGDF